MRQVAGTLRLDLAQFRDLAAFAQFGSEEDLDKATQAQLKRGRRLVEVLKQPQYSPMAVEEQVLIIWAGTNGQLDDLEVEQVRAFEQGLIEFCRNTRGSLLQNIAEKKILTDELKEEMKTAVTEFKGRFASGAGRKAAASL